jgi:hypothetical protein
MAIFSYTCAQCGIAFETPKRGKKFCKQQCYFASKDKHVTIVCEVCGNRNGAKRLAAQAWCVANDVTYAVITEDELKT